MKDKKPFSTDEFLTEWCKGKTFSEETRDQSYCEFAEAFHREKFSAMGDEDLVFRAYGQICELNGKTEERQRILGIIEEYNHYGNNILLNEITKEIKG